MHKLQRPSFSEPPQAPSVGFQQLDSSTSRTMKFAQNTMDSPTLLSARPLPDSLSLRKTPVSSFRALRPTSPIRGEQYWTARALTAETLLAASAMHQEQIKVMTEAGEVKHQLEVAELNRQHEARHSKLERLAMLLMTWLVSIVAVLVYMLVRGSSPPATARWVGPLHFTIPVLSPFTSVTEHETSALNTRTIIIAVLSLSYLGYACFTYWIKNYKR